MRVALLFLAIASILFSCVSRTLPGERFRDSKVLTTPTISRTPSNSNVFSFAIVGDVHVGEDASRISQIASQATAEGDDFIVLLGDIADEGKRESFVAVRTALNSANFLTRHLSVIGNHDIFDGGWSDYKELMGPSHYTVNYGNSQFITLDTADGTIGEEQYEWLEGELAKARPAHTFVLSHYLPIVPNQRTYLKLSNEEEAIRVMRLSQNQNVTAWLGGHYHSYVNESVEGVQYVVAGGGGGRRMEPIKENFFVQVSVNGDNVTYTLRILQ